MSFITLAEATAMTTKCREEKTAILKTEFQSSNIIFTCETFAREDFEALLRQDGCVKIRVYSGMDSDLKMRLIAVGVDGNNQDMLPGGDELDSENNIVEDGQRCPDICPPDSPLNS